MRVAPEASVVAALALDGALRGIGLQHLQHDAAISTQDLAPHLHIGRQLLVAAPATLSTISRVRYWPARNIDLPPTRLKGIAGSSPSSDGGRFA